jgi:hypothetical protein
LKTDFRDAFKEEEREKRVARRETKRRSLLPSLSLGCCWEEGRIICYIMYMRFV